jgi:hypothetical protein
MLAILSRRWRETEACLGVQAYLASTVMMGALLEAMLLARLIAHVRRVSDLNLGAVLVMPADALLSALELGDGPSAPEHVVVLGGADQIVGVALRTRLLEQSEGGDKTRLLADIARRDFVTIPESATLVELLGRMATAHASVAVVVPSSPEAGAKPVVGIITQSAMAEALAAGMELFGD